MRYMQQKSEGRYIPWLYHRGLVDTYHMTITVLKFDTRVAYPEANEWTYHLHKFA